MSQPKLCANFVYDLNGSKGPNTAGKDIGFISVLYPTDSVVVAPIPLIQNAGTSEQSEAGALCLKQDSESRLPNREELASMFYNHLLIGGTTNWDLWSSTLTSANTAYYMHLPTGRFINRNRSYNTVDVRCVKR